MTFILSCCHGPMCTVQPSPRRDVFAVKTCTEQETTIYDNSNLLVAGKKNEKELETCYVAKKLFTLVYIQTYGTKFVLQLII